MDLIAELNGQVSRESQTMPCSYDRSNCGNRSNLSHAHRAMLPSNETLQGDGLRNGLPCEMCIRPPT
jgi:hypothetical protein